MRKEETKKKIKTNNKSGMNENKVRGMPFFTSIEILHIGSRKTPSASDFYTFPLSWFFCWFISSPTLKKKISLWGQRKQPCPSILLKVYLTMGRFVHAPSTTAYLANSSLSEMCGCPPELSFIRFAVLPQLVTFLSHFESFAFIHTMLNLRSDLFQPNLH